MCREIKNKWVKTRKEHKCLCCLRNFPKGTEMIASTNVGNNCIYTVYMCDTCIDILEWDARYGDFDWHDIVDEEYTLLMMNGHCFKGTPEEFLKELENKK